MGKKKKNKRKGDEGDVQRRMRRAKYVLERRANKNYDPHKHPWAKNLESKRHEYARQKKIQHLNFWMRELPDQTVPLSGEFSVTTNPNYVFERLNTILEVADHAAGCRKKRLYLDMSDLQGVDFEALFCLHSTLFKLRRLDARKANCLKIDGPLPQNEVVRDMLQRCNFLKDVKKLLDPSRPHDRKLQSQYVYNNLPSQKIAYEIDKVAFEHTHSKDDQFQLAEFKEPNNILIELMGNTKNHAPEQKYTDEFYTLKFELNKENGVSKIIFVDAGIGIIEDRKRSEIEEKQGWLKKLLSSSSNAHSDILEKMLTGKYEFTSSTKKQHHGKGTKALMTALRMGEIRNLRIISNKAHIQVSDAELSIESLDLTTSFSGTLVAFEMHPIKPW